MPGWGRNVQSQDNDLIPLGWWFFLMHIFGWDLECTLGQLQVYEYYAKSGPYQVQPTHHCCQIPSSVGIAAARRHRLLQSQPCTFECSLCTQAVAVLPCALCLSRPMLFRRFRSCGEGCVFFAECGRRSCRHISPNSHDKPESSCPRFCTFARVFAMFHAYTSRRERPHTHETLVYRYMHVFVAWGNPFPFRF